MTEKILTKRFGKIDPLSIDDYLNSDGYKALKKSIDMPASYVIKELKVSELKGRGGSGISDGYKNGSRSKSAQPYPQNMLYAMRMKENLVTLRIDI